MLASNLIKQYLQTLKPFSNNPVPEMERIEKSLHVRDIYDEFVAFLQELITEQCSLRPSIICRSCDIVVPREVVQFYQNKLKTHGVYISQHDMLNKSLIMLFQTKTFKKMHFYLLGRIHFRVRW